MSALRRDDRHDRPLELAALALDYDLTAAETRELSAHVASCPACARRVAAMRADARLLGRPLVLLPSARVDAAVAAAIAGRRRQTPPQRLVLLAAAALLLLAMLGAIAVGAALVRDLELLPMTERTVLRPPAAVVSPAPDPTSAPVGETWAVMPFDAASGGANLEAVTFSGADLVGVGRGGCVVDSDGNGECQAAVWTSDAASGGSWARAPEQPGLAVGLGFSTGGPEKGIFDVAAGPAGLVAIGYDIDPLRSACAVAPCTSGPGVWRSTDGRVWERLQVDFGPGFVDTYSEPIAAIAAGPQGYVMVGYALVAGPGGDPEARATAWASPDGVTWTRADHNEGLTLGQCLDTGEQPDCGGMRAVAATPTGYVAVGYRYEAGTTRSPAAWTSPDGLEWTLAMAGLDYDGDLSAVVAGGPGIVAVGSICQPSCLGANDGVAAVSSDGSTWTFAAIAGAPGLQDVASVGGSTFAIGARGPDADPQAELHVWRTDDGAAWQRVTGLPSISEVVGYRAVDLAAAADRMVVTGWAEVSGDATFRNFAYSSPPAGATDPSPAP
jgi:hypothetical protein